MLRYKILRISALLFIACGLVSMVPIGLIWLSQHSTSHLVSASAIRKANLTPAAITGHPVALDIPSLNIHLAVIDGYYNSSNGQWTLTPNKAQFALPSTPPNDQSGNTLIYGHYRAEVFASLHQIAVGSVVEITTDNGYKFYYTYTGTEALDPTDTSIFQYVGKPRLTIQTCSGNYFQNRQMYYFNFTAVRKIAT